MHVGICNYNTKSDDCYLSYIAFLCIDCKACFFMIMLERFQMCNKFLSFRNHYTERKQVAQACFTKPIMILGSNQNISVTRSRSKKVLIHPIQMLSTISPSSYTPDSDFWLIIDEVSYFMTNERECIIFCRQTYVFIYNIHIRSLINVWQKILITSLYISTI